MHRRVEGSKRLPAQMVLLQFLQIELDDDHDRGLFSGPTSLTVPANSEAQYPLKFAPPWIGTFMGTLTLAIPATLETSTYRLTGRGLEPAAAGHLTVRRAMHACALRMHFDFSRLRVSV